MRPRERSCPPSIVTAKLGRPRRVRLDRQPAGAAGARLRAGAARAAGRSCDSHSPGRRRSAALRLWTANTSRRSSRPTATRPSSSTSGAHGRKSPRRPWPVSLPRWHSSAREASTRASPELKDDPSVPIGVRATMGGAGGGAGDQLRHQGLDRLLFDSPSEVEFDMTAVNFIESSALEIMLRVHHRN